MRKTGRRIQRCRRCDFMKKVVTLVLAFVFAVSLAGCAQTVHVDFPFDPADLDFIEMFHFYTPAEAEKKSHHRASRHERPL